MSYIVRVGAFDRRESTAQMAYGWVRDFLHAGGVAVRRETTIEVLHVVDGMPSRTMWCETFHGTDPWEKTINSLQVLKQTLEVI